MSTDNVSSQEQPAGEPLPGEHPLTHFDREDNRWQPQYAIRDWLILAAMIAMYVLWAGVVYFFEPGIR